MSDEDVTVEVMEVRVSIGDRCVLLRRWRDESPPTWRLMAGDATLATFTDDVYPQALELAAKYLRAKTEGDRLRAEAVRVEDELLTDFETTDKLRLPKRFTAADFSRQRSA